MSAETASSSDVASVENGTAVQQNFTPPVSKSALFDNIVDASPLPLGWSMALPAIVFSGG